jgi:hypothetical protein
MSENPGDDRVIPSGVRRLAVFSHPNHELAIFGLMMRARAYSLFLTDGGGEHRLAETRAGLTALGLLDRATFLNHSEDSFYGALLDNDLGFFRQVSAQIRDCVESTGAEEIWCDAVEFYNPVHDMALPLVARAVEDLSEIPVFHVPLIYQRPEAAGGPAYAVQRALEAAPDAIEVRLSPVELAAKRRGLDETYAQLRGQLGAVITDLPEEHLAGEVLLPPNGHRFEPTVGQVLRYVARGRLLLEQGDVDRVITHRKHYLPLVSGLLEV